MNNSLFKLPLIKIFFNKKKIKNLDTQIVNHMVLIIRNYLVRVIYAEL